MNTEARSERYRGADRWPTGDSLAAMLDNQMAAFFAVRNALGALETAVRAAAGRLAGSEGRLVYVGCGASGRLAVQDGIELYPTFHWPRDRLVCLIAGGSEALVRSIEGGEDDAEAAQRDIADNEVGRHDVVIAVAASGTTTYTCAAQTAAKQRGALTIALANNPDAPLLTGADHPVLLDTGPEFLAGSTRMTAGTAQKIALNLLSTQLMTELGRVHDGHMVCVVASNAKLVRRAERILAAISGCSAEEAPALLERAGRDIRTAVLLHDGLPLDEARRRLEAANGHLRRARERGRP